MSLVDDLLPLVDLENSIAASLGARPYAAWVRTESFDRAISDAAINLGPTDLPLVPPPEVTKLTAAQASYFGGGPLGSASGELGPNIYQLAPIARAYAQLASAVTASGSGAGTITPSASIPTAGVTGGTYPVVVQCVLGGALGVATFQCSLDGGVTWTAVAGTPASFSNASIGLAVALSGSFGPGDAFAFSWLCGGFTIAQLLPASSARGRALVKLTGPDLDPAGELFKPLDVQLLDAMYFRVTVKEVTSVDGTV